MSLQPSQIILIGLSLVLLSGNGGENNCITVPFEVIQDFHWIVSGQITFLLGSLLEATDLAELSSMLLLSIAVTSIQGRLGRGFVSCLNLVLHLLNPHQNFELRVWSSFLLCPLEGTQTSLVPFIGLFLRAGFLRLPSRVAIDMDPICVGVDTAKLFIMLSFPCSSLHLFVF